MSVAASRGAIEPPKLVLTTANQTGPIAIIQLHGEGVVSLLRRLTGSADWPTGGVRLVDFGDIDRGLALWLPQGLGGARHPWAQLMPHGGPRVVQKLVKRLLDLGAVFESEPDPLDVYPEAGNRLEAESLAAIARAASPAAIDLLAHQPSLWRMALRRHSAGGGHDPDHAGAGSLTDRHRVQILGRSEVLDRLIDPSLVVVVGQPNVGKSTLTNQMLGRSVSIVADLPGTTRDWVAGLAEISGSSSIDAPLTQVAVRWMDTPGLRPSTDRIEQEAIALARGVIGAADVLIAMRDSTRNWPCAESLARRPDLWVLNKVDDPQQAGEGLGAGPEAPLSVSALNGRGLDTLQRRVLELLELDPIQPSELWAFTPWLRQAVATGDFSPLRSSVGRPAR